MGIVGTALKLIAIPIVLVVIVAVVGYLFYLRKLKQADVERDPVSIAQLPPYTGPLPAPAPTYQPQTLQHQPPVVTATVISNDPYGQYFHEMKTSRG